MSSDAPKGPFRQIEALPERLSVGAGCILLGVALATTWAVFMRYVLRQPIHWTYDVSGYVFLAVCATGVSYAMVERRHINVDLFVTKLHGKKRQAADLFSLGVTLFWSVFVMWGTWNRTMFAMRTGKVGTNLEFPLWTVDIVVPIGMAIFVLIGLIHLRRDIAQFGKLPPGNKKPEGGHS